MKILIIGKPGAGKTTLAKLLAEDLDAIHFEADKIRDMFKDWRFDYDGRWIQAQRMKALMNLGQYVKEHVIADFVCPTEELRDQVDADYIIWIDHPGHGMFKDTVDMWEEPKEYDFKYTRGDHNEVISDIITNNSNAG